MGNIGLPVLLTYLISLKLMAHGLGSRIALADQLSRSFIVCAAYALSVNMDNQICLCHTLAFILQDGNGSRLAKNGGE